MVSSPSLQLLLASTWEILNKNENNEEKHTNAHAHTLCQMRDVVDAFLVHYSAPSVVTLFIRHAYAHANACVWKPHCELVLDSRVEFVKELTDDVGVNTIIHNTLLDSDSPLTLFVPLNILRLKVLARVIAHEYYML